MSFNPDTNYNISPTQCIKILKQLSDRHGVAFYKAVNVYNNLTSHNQYAGDAINGGSDGCRVDISVDPRRPVIHVEIDAVDSGLFFRCEIEGDIVVQEVAL